MATKRGLRPILLVATACLLLPAASFAQGKFIRIATASMGGAFYPLGNALAQLLSEKMPAYISSSQATGGSVENCRLLQRKEVELAFIQSATLREAVNAQGKFQTAPVKEMQAITAIYFMPFHVIVRKDAKIKNISDLKGKRVALGPVASGIEVNALALLESYGITKKDIKPVHQNQDESYEALKVGSVDALIYATGAGSAQITDVMLSGKTDILSIERGKVDAMIKKYPEFGPMVIPAGTYPNQSREISTIAGSAVLVTRPDLDADLVYEITKAIFTSADFLVQRHDYYKQTTPKNATVGIVLDLHPGAARYLKEIKAIK